MQPSYHHALDQGEFQLHSIEPVSHDHSDLREFVALLRRHALLIAVVAIVTGVSTFAVSAGQAKQYVATTTLLYAPRSGTTSLDSDPTRAMGTLVGIAASNTVLAPIARHYKLTVAELQSAVTVRGDTTSDILTVSVDSTNPSRAAAIANSISRTLIANGTARTKNLLNAQITFLQQQLQALTGKVDPSSVAAAASIRTQLAQSRAELATETPDVSVLTPASTPSSPSSPHPKRNGAIGLLVGLVLGIMIGFLRDRLDRRMRGIDEVEAIYRAPLLGIVPFTKRGALRAELLADFSGAGTLADAYRTIRTNLSLFQVGGSKTSVIIVTSAAPSEGKSAVAANLAHALSVTGKNVLAVSADLHDPTLHQYFGHRVTDSTGPMAPILQRSDVLRTQLMQTRRPAGLVQVLSGEVTLDEGARVIPLSARERASGGKLAVLANESTFFDPAALFSSGQMKRFLQLARQQYDVIVIDTPPLLVNADAALLSQAANALVMVARLNHLTRNQARRAVRVMSATHITPTGTIVTGDVAEPAYGYGEANRYDPERTHPSSGAAGEHQATSNA